MKRENIYCIKKLLWGGGLKWEKKGNKERILDIEEIGDEVGIEILVYQFSLF